MAMKLRVLQNRPWDGNWCNWIASVALSQDRLHIVQSIGRDYSNVGNEKYLI